MKDGEGTEYREDGSVRYKGSFAEDLFDGEGVYFLEGGKGAIHANFAAGRTDGAISWYVDGKLWYEGGADDLTPDGFGTLYARSGKPVYAGEMDRGTLDGAWLLGLTVEELRTAFCEANVTEQDSEGGGFLIANQELGLTALCSYRQEDAEAAVCALWLSGGEAGMLSGLLPWKTAAEFGDWAAALGEAKPQDSLSEEAVEAVAAWAPSEGTYEPATYAFGDWSVTALVNRDSKAPFAIRWDSGRTPAPLSAANADETGQSERLDQLLAGLKLLDGAGKKGSSKPSGSDVGRLIALSGSANDAKTLIDTLLSYDIYKQTLSLLEESKELAQKLLAGEQENEKRGAGDAKRIQSLQTQLDEMDGRIARTKAEMEKAALKVQEMTLLNPADYALDRLICSFDPAKLDAAALYDAAVAYAQGVSAGLYAVDAEGIALTVKEEVINLELVYQEVQSALGRRQRAQEAADEALKAYAKSSVDRFALYQAQIARNEAAIALYEALAEFAGQVNALNALSGGWLSKEAAWLDDVLPAIYQNEVGKGRAQAEAKEQEQIQKEQEAKEQLEEGKP